MNSRRTGALAVLLLALGGWQFGEAIWIHGKALLAQTLIQRAWDDTRSGDARVRPWYWADTWPIARLAVPRLEIDQIVLAGSSGRTLAFGPGHMDGTARPLSDGLTVLTGHRDTHFSFLRAVKPGDMIDLTDGHGVSRRYRTAETRVVDSRLEGLADDRSGARLVLVTCYPFDAVRPGGPMRFLVLADAIDAK
ncbi:MAG: class GN sortase, partial [Alphaproteobacteria bacterium]|nr:class GN sortase [Alphaproteobacteria bacterium]